MSIKTNRKNSDAVSILHRRYIKDSSERKASLKEERVKAQFAQLIYDLRKEAGLSQQKLAEMIGTTQLKSFVTICSKPRDYYNIKTIKRKIDKKR